MSVHFIWQNPTSITKDKSLSNTLKSLAYYFTLVYLLIALLTLFGWIFSIEFFKQPIPNVVAMNATTALCFLFTGSSFLLLNFHDKSRPLKVGGLILILIPLVIGILRISEARHLLSFQIDQVLWADKGLAQPSNNSVRMAISTAVCFVLLSLSMISQYSNYRRMMALSNHISFLVFLIALFSLVGYLYHVTEFFDLQSNDPMAFRSAIGFVLASMALIFYNPCGVFSIISSTQQGGKLARLLIPATIIVPVLFGLLRLSWHWQNPFRVELGVAFLILALIITFLTIVLSSAHLINRQENRQKNADVKFQSILESAPDAMIIVDQLGSIQIINTQTETLFGYNRKELLGQKIEILIPSRFAIHHSDNRNDFFANAKTRSMGVGLELFAKKKSGAEFPVEISLSPFTAGNDHFVSAAVRDITNRKKIEIRLKEFEHFFNNSNDLSCIANKDGYFEIINPSFEKVLGYTKNELTENPFLDFVHPDEFTATLKVYEQLRSGASIIHFTNRYRKKNGEYLWFDWNATSNPLTGKLYCIARDITEQRIAEEALNKLNAELEQKVKERTEEIVNSEKRFRSLIENSSEGIALTDESANVIYRSPGSQKITGNLPKDEVINLTHPDDLSALKNIHAEVLSKPLVPVPFQGRFLHETGNYIWLEGTFTNLLGVDGVNAIVANYRDVTKRKELEDLLHKSNSLARIGSWEVDLLKGTVYWNDITREIHEAESSFVPDLATGINFYKEGPGRDLITQKVKEAIELGKPWDEELEIITAKNNVRWIRTIGEAEFEDGKCIRIYGSFQDINERKKAEEKLAELNAELELKVKKRTEQLEEANRELEAFSYSVSHDLRAPLRAINGYAKMLEEDYGSLLDSNGKRLIGIVRENARQMGQLIDDLLSFSRIGRKELEKSMINLDQMARIIAEEINVIQPSATITIASLHPVWGDRTLIKQALFNYLSNAVKYSSKVENPKVEVTSTIEDNSIIVSVRDNGTGFDKTYAHKLFQVFQRLHRQEEFEGTGVGLAIVARIIQKHDGKTWAEGEPGKGATFYFSLPHHTIS